MSTYEHDLLTKRFAALAPQPLPGDWDDVLDRSGAVRPRRSLLARSLWRGGRGRKLVVALAVAVLVGAVAAAAYGTVRVLFLDRGFIGLPREGATPSNPEHGELVLFYWGEVPGDSGKSRFWVYTDGRLISLREANRPEGANPRSTGYLEQRLTPEGLELLRSEIISIGLIGDEASGAGIGEATDTDDDVAIGSKPAPWDATKPLEDWRRLQVRDGDQLYQVSRVGDLDRLVARLTDPGSWLPASAWAVREIRAYVPSRYGCASRDSRRSNRPTSFPCYRSRRIACSATASSLQAPLGPAPI